MAGSLIAAGRQRLLNVRPDAPDLRDRLYEPSLIPLASSMSSAGLAPVLDQGQEGACTGFGLATVINIMRRQLDPSLGPVSERMLYEMARKHDEWPGDDHAGSSCRGAIRGWKNMGVCRAANWPFVAGDTSELTVERAIDARSVILGAYYRLRPELNDYHAALNETGAIFVSANVHDGWNVPEPVKKDEMAVIKPAVGSTGGHAFAVVGYNQTGFIVQNSWGDRWGSNGLAVWRYEDWFDSITDGWVFQLAVSTPWVFDLTVASPRSDHKQAAHGAPKRLEIAGHFVHFDDGRLVTHGNYWSTHHDLEQTADRIAFMARENRIRHLLIYAHGGLNSPGACARRIKALKDGFKRNGIYPIHLMYDTGLAEEMADLVRRAFARSEGVIDRWRDKLLEKADMVIEDAVRKPGTALWEEMKRDAQAPFASAEADGTKLIGMLIESLRDADIRLHLAGHSTGAILLGHLLAGLDEVMEVEFDTCQLMAPAASVASFGAFYRSRLARPASGVSVSAMHVYNLSDALESADTVAHVYHKSLLYLVSRAFERGTSPRPLIGMQRYAARLKQKGLRIHVATGARRGLTQSTTHGGFDNDPATMNTVLRRILRQPSTMPFLPAEMDY